MKFDEKLKERLGNNSDFVVTDVDSLTYSLKMYWLGRTDKLSHLDSSENYELFIDLTNDYSGFKKKLDKGSIIHTDQKFDPDKEIISYAEAENNIKNFLNSWVKDNLEVEKPKKKKRFGLF